MRQKIKLTDASNMAGKELHARNADDAERVNAVAKHIKSGRGTGRRHAISQLPSTMFQVQVGNVTSGPLEDLQAIQSWLDKQSQPKQLRETRELAEQPNGTIRKKSKAEIAAWDKAELDKLQRQRELENREFLATAISEGLAAAIAHQTIADSNRNQADLGYRERLAEKFALQDKHVAEKKAEMAKVMLDPLATTEQKLAAQRAWVESYAYDPDDVDVNTD